MAPWDYLGDPDINVSLRKVAYTYLRRRSLLLLVRNGTKCSNLEHYCDSDRLGNSNYTRQWKTSLDRPLQRTRSADAVTGAMQSALAGSNYNRRPQQE